MTLRPLRQAIVGAYLDRGFVEATFSIGRGSGLRVCVRVPDVRALDDLLHEGDLLLPDCVADLPRVEALMAEARPLAEGLAWTVWDVWLNGDGSASYTCGCEDEPDKIDLVDVVRDRLGRLSVG